MGQDIVTVDAFTAKPFAGNPAAVCLMEKAADEQWMQNVAMEMNLSETAFLYPIGDSKYHLRWFTPKDEVALCGHATLASAHVLYTDGHLAKDVIARFETLSGELTAQMSKGMIELNFPEQKATECEPPKGLIEAIGAPVRFVGKSKSDYLVELLDESSVRNLNPDIATLKNLQVRGVIVTAQSDNNPYDFVSRFFAPGVGVDEDPVTGSAHCTLAPFWKERLNKEEFLAYQASGRGGEVSIKIENDRVKLSGHAITMLRGTLQI